MATAEVMDDTIKKFNITRAPFRGLFMLSLLVQLQSAEASLIHLDRETYFRYLPKNSRVRCQASFAAASL